MINDMYLMIDSETEPKNFELCFDYEENIIYANYHDVRLLTIFVTEEIHVECVIPVNSLILFSNSMSYSFSKIVDCQNDCINVVNTLDSVISNFHELVENYSDCFNFIDTDCDCRLELLNGGYMKFGVKKNGFYCDVFLKGKGLTLTPLELDLALTVGRVLNVNPTIVKVEESLPKSDVFKIE